jgi:arsenate reductase
VLLTRRAIAEGVGTMLLVTAVVGSGIAAQRLSPDAGVELLVNAFATAGALVAILLALGPLHLNPAVSAVAAAYGRLPRRELAVYVPAQVAGGCAGAVLANLMYGGAAVSISTHQRSGAGLILAEVVATAGLMLVAFRVRAEVAPFAIAAYIASAYFFTSSTSFANPAVTVARTLSDTFAGIAPASVAAFVAAQLAGAAVGAVLVRLTEEKT